MHTGVTQVVHIAQSHLASILDRSGRVLYSSVSTLKPGAVYLLGLNPGGNPETPDVTHYSIAESLKRLPTKDWNDFVHESWRGYPPGESTLQRRVRWLLQEIGYDVAEVCASNLIFVRSQNSSGAEYPLNADLCWPVHECILKIVQPSLVLTYEKKVFDYIAKNKGATFESEIPSGHGNWKCRSASVINEGFCFTLIQVPHLSRYNIIGKRHVVKWIESQYRSLAIPASSL